MTSAVRSPARRGQKAVECRKNVFWVALVLCRNEKNSGRRARPFNRGKAHIFAQEEVKRTKKRIHVMQAVMLVMMMMMPPSNAVQRTAMQLCVVF